MPATRRFPKKGYTTFTMQLSEHEREDLEAVRKLLGVATRSSAVRGALRRLRHLLEVVEQRKGQIALVDDKDNAVVIHFVM